MVFFRCWLEVADGQVASGRIDAAKELLTKILNHNNSCAAAYQYLGIFYRLILLNQLL